MIVCVCVLCVSALGIVGQARVVPSRTYSRKNNFSAVPTRGVSMLSFSSQATV